MKLHTEKKTKIVCTIGPASDSAEMIEKLYDEGMDVMRINFSHGSHEEQLQKIEIVRAFEKRGIYIPVCLDTKGPEIRTGYMENGLVEVHKGQRMHICMEPLLGNAERFSCSYKGLYDDVKEGDPILVDDGNLILRVKSKDPNKRELLVEAENDHPIKDQKGMNVPNSDLSMPFISKQDEADLRFGAEHDVDAIFASFVRRPEDIVELKKVLAKYGKPDIPIFAKIENPEGVRKIEEIVKISDGIMVARGDLGDEIPPEIVPLVQRRIIKLCRQYGKPVITATQMLDSMTTHPRPTRAEVSDVATAIDESSDCVMLSGESASGKYPSESVRMQKNIAKAMEGELPYESLAKEAFDSSEHTVNDAIANSIANTALLIGAKLIVNFSQTGNSSKRMSKARPSCPIISITNSRKACLESAWYWGVYSHLIHTSMPDFIEEMEALALKVARDLGIEEGSPIIIAGGTPTGAGKTNFMRIVNVNAVHDID